MGFLYISPKGIPWRKHSYSAGNLYDKSPSAYKLQKIDGWKEKDNKAAFLFGRALEESIQYHHDHNGEGAVLDFQRRWDEHKEKTDLQFTLLEKDWSNLYCVGTEMIQLYVIRQPELPIPLGGQTVFQREFAKEVFPGDPNYGEIEDIGKLDIISWVEPAHPMLQKLFWKAEYGILRPLIVDIKTSGKDFPDNPGIAAFDKQLRRYSWQSGIRDVALLWFTKKNRTYKKGNSVTLLRDVYPFRKGQEAVICFIQQPVYPTSQNPFKESPIPEGIYLVANDFIVTLMESAQGRRPDGDLDTTNEAKNRKNEWIMKNAVYVEEGDITKQRLQFNCGFVTVESAQEAGQIAARQIVNIVNSFKTNTWPSTFGIRFPTDDRKDPYFRAFVLKDEAFKLDHFKKAEEETMDDLFREVEETGEPDEN